MKKIVTLFFCFFLLHVNAQSLKVEEIDKLDNLKVTMETNLGNITLKLYPKIAPKAVENFVTHAENGYYEGVIFHRVIKNFMIQGGDPTGTGRGGNSIWDKKFEDEVSTYTLFDRPGLIAMANAGPNTNGSQFFITTVSTPWLNLKHTIFGEVIDGMNVVKKIENSPTQQDRPIEKIYIIKIHLN